MNNLHPTAHHAIGHSGERGFTMVSAIFILVVLALLGAAIVTVSTSQQLGSTSDLLGTRAYAAARAGIEWGLYQVNSSNSWSSTTPNTRTCPTSPTTFALPATASTLSGFTVTVTCTPYPDAANGGPTVYQIDAVACNVPVGSCPGTLGRTYVERRMRVSL